MSKSLNPSEKKIYEWPTDTQRYSTSTITTEIKINTTKRYRYTSSGKTEIVQDWQHQTLAKTWRSWNAHIFAEGNVNTYPSLENRLAVSFQVGHSFIWWLRNPSWVCNQEKGKHMLTKRFMEDLLIISKELEISQMCICRSLETSHRIVITDIAGQ